MAYKLTQQLISGMFNKGVINTTDIDDVDSSGVRKTQREINADIYSKLPSTGTTVAGITRVTFNSETNEIEFANNENTVICTLDTTPFLNDISIDNMDIEDVVIDNETVKCLVFKFNDEDKENINVPIKDIIDQDLFYTKTEIDSYNENINSSITDLQNSRLFKEENGGLKTNINNKASGVNSFSEGLTTNALGINSHSEGKGLNISSNLEEAYTAGSNFIIVDNNENITIGSKLYYPKKVESADVLALSSDTDDNINFIQILLSAGFVENINAGEYIYINNNNEFTPVEVVFNYTAGDTTIKVSEDADNIEIGTILSSNSIDTPFGIKTITNIEPVGNNIKLYLNSPIEYNLTTTDTIYIKSGVASGQGSHSEGLGTNAGGDYSHTSGVFTNTKNEGEFACGTKNKSTEDVTMFSVGIGETNYLNAVEVTKEGDLFIKGAGGYDGTNPNSSTSVQDLLLSIGGNSEITVDSENNLGIIEDDQNSYCFPLSLITAPSNLGISADGNDKSKSRILTFSSNDANDKFDYRIYSNNEFGNWTSSSNKKLTITASNDQKETLHNVQIRAKRYNQIVKYPMDGENDSYATFKTARYMPNIIITANTGENIEYGTFRSFTIAVKSGETAITGGQIFYTINGDDPLTNGTEYQGSAVTINQKTAFNQESYTIKAVYKATDWEPTSATNVSVILGKLPVYYGVVNSLPTTDSEVAALGHAKYVTSLTNLSITGITGSRLQYVVFAVKSDLTINTILGNNQTYEFNKTGTNTAHYKVYYVQLSGTMSNTFKWDINKS